MSRYTLSFYQYFLCGNQLLFWSFSTHPWPNLHNRTAQGTSDVSATTKTSSSLTHAETAAKAEAHTHAGAVTDAMVASSTSSPAATGGNSHVHSSLALINAIEDPGFFGSEPIETRANGKKGQVEHCHYLDIPVEIRQCLWCFDVFTDVVLRNRDRISAVWPLVLNHIRSILVSCDPAPTQFKFQSRSPTTSETKAPSSQNSSSHVPAEASVTVDHGTDPMSSTASGSTERLMFPRSSFPPLVIEAAVVCLLKLGLRLVHKEPISRSVVGSLRLLLHVDLSHPV